MHFPHAELGLPDAMYAKRLMRMSLHVVSAWLLRKFPLAGAYQELGARALVRGSEKEGIDIMARHCSYSPTPRVALTSV